MVSTGASGQGFVQFTGMKKAVARPSSGDARGVAGAVHADALSNGVKLRRDFAVADQRYGNHKHRRANDPQPEEPTSPIHCSANPRPSGWIINVSSING